LALTLKTRHNRIAEEALSGITRDRIRKLLIHATGLAALSKSKSKELTKAEHKNKYGKK
jgi:hypothetical protein